MKKKNLLIIIIPVIVVIIAAIFLFLPKKEVPPKDMNLLLITLDTTRADHIGIYGNAKADTANIDKLAKNGVYFKHCYTPVPLTLPAHCSLFTGKYPIAHNVRNNARYALADDEPTLAEMFKNKGFTNYAVVAAYVLVSKFGLSRGFDVYDDSLNPKKSMLDLHSEIPANEVYDKFKSWFDKNNEKKFFAWVHFFDPHAPYEPPAGIAVKGDRLADKYAGEIAYMDLYIGKIVADLEAAGVLDNTLIVVVGDHGEAFGEHVEFGHGIFAYEEAVKVPLIFSNKAMFKQHLAVENRVSLVDIFPTLADLFDGEPPAGVQGASFVNLLHGDTDKTERTIYIESMYGKEENNWAPLTGVIDGPMKYVALPKPELYNLEKDPGEKTNIYRRKPSVSRRYDQKLKEVLLKYSTTGKDTKRKLSARDTAHLKSLGYISDSGGKTAKVTDPKDGVVLDIKLKELHKKVTEGDPDAAEVELKGLLAEDSPLRHPMIYGLLDKIYRKRGDGEAAMANLSAGIKAYPDSDDLNLRYLTELYTRKEHDKAIEHSKKILDRNPYFTHAYAVTGDIYLDRQELDKAAEFFGKAAELEPENTELNFKYAKTLLTLKRFDEAAPVYDKLSTMEPYVSDHKFQHWYALFHFSYGSSERAEQLIGRAIELEPNGNYYFYYALILSKNKKYAEAVGNMEIAIQKYPHHLNDRQRNDAGLAIAQWKQEGSL